MRVYIGHAPAEQCGLKEYLHGWDMYRLREMVCIKRGQILCKMESQDSDYRKAMIDLRRFEPKKKEAVICFTCAGFSSFGGLEAEDMTVGPMCVCDKTWNKVHAHISKMKGKKLLTI